MNSSEPRSSTEDEQVDDLSAEEYALAAASREIVLTLMPEFLPELIEAGKLGWIEGWRSVYAWKHTTTEE